MRRLTSDARRWVPLIIGLAIGLRIGLALTAAIGLPGSAHPFPDSVDYDLLGRALAEHHPYVVQGAAGAWGGGETWAARMPGYPLLIAAIYMLGGTIPTVLIAQAFMGGAIVLLAYLIGRRFGRGVGLVAAAAASLDPLSLGFSISFLTETGFTLLLMLSLWMGLRILEGGDWKWWVALGITWAVAVYFRASALWCIVPLVAWLAFMRNDTSLAAASSMKLSTKTRARGLMFASITVAVVFVMLMPWLVRNYNHFQGGGGGGKGFFRLTTLQGISLYEAVYPEADGGPRQDKIALPDDMKAMNEAQRSDEWSRRAWAYVRSDPVRIIELAFIKMARTWSPGFNDAGFRGRAALNALLAAWYLPLFALAIVGFAAPAKESLWGRHKIILLIPLLYFTAVHALYQGSVRYRAPLMPIVCIFAAAGIVFLWQRLRPSPTLGRDKGLPEFAQ